MEKNQRKEPSPIRAVLTGGVRGEREVTGGGFHLAASSHAVEDGVDCEGSEECEEVCITGDAS